MADAEAIAHIIVPLHQYAVLETMRRLMQMDGRSEAEQDVALYWAQYFNETRPFEDALIACHDDPFETACDRLGIADDLRETLFEEIRSFYDPMMEGLDEEVDGYDPPNLEDEPPPPSSSPAPGT